MSKTSTNTNIFELIKKGQYKYKYIWVEKKGGKFKIGVFVLVFSNINSYICHTLTDLHSSMLLEKFCGPGSEHFVFQVAQYSWILFVC